MNPNLEATDSFKQLQNLLSHAYRLKFVFPRYSMSRFGSHASQYLNGYPALQHDLCKRILLAYGNEYEFEPLGAGPDRESLRNKFHNAKNEIEIAKLLKTRRKQLRDTTGFFSDSSDDSDPTMISRSKVKVKYHLHSARKH